MPSPRHILVVDDEKDLAELLAYNLRKQGHAVSLAFTGPQALAAIASQSPDLVVLDLMLPEISGIEVAARLRGNPLTARIPILMLTAKSEEHDQVIGFSAGADDYVTKPYSLQLVLARVEALLRRSASATPDSILRAGSVEVHLDTHEVVSGAAPVKLTLTEYRLLVALLQAQGRVLSRQVLMSKAIGPGVTVTERTIDVHITAVRKKLGNAGAMIRTVRGVGYRASPEPDAASGIEQPSVQA